MEFAAGGPDYGALRRPCDPRPGRYWKSAARCRQGTVAEVNTLMAEHRETVSPQAASGSLRDSERQLHLVAGNGPFSIAHFAT